ncbi:MAG TPA: MFS transporter [Anaeromyxobacter sp.]|nr:MFS transporter [Anaeromyxobacter sp.]
MSFRSHLRAAAGGLPPAFWVLWWGVLLNRAASFVVGFLALYLVEERGFGPAAAGRVLALYGVGGILASLLGGVLADRVGRRRTMLLSLAASATAVTALAFARAPALLAALTFLAGASGQMYPPALNAAVADVVRFEERPRAFGLVYWGANVGFGLGYAIAGLVSTRSLSALFLLDAATTTGFALLVLFRLPETRPAHAGRQAALAGLGRVLSDRPFMVFLALNLMALLVFTQWELMLGVDVTAHGVGRGGYALLLWLNCAVVILIQPVIGPRLRARDPTSALVASSLFLGLGYGLNAVSSALPLYVVGVAIWTLGEAIGMPVASALAAALAPPSLRGRYQGVYGLTFSLAYAVSPVLSGELAARCGARAVWLACLAMGMLVAAGHLAAAGPRRRRLAERARGEPDPCPDVEQPAA